VQVRREFDKLAHGTRSPASNYGGSRFAGQIAKLHAEPTRDGHSGRVIDLIDAVPSICVQFKLSCWTKPIECSISASDPDIEKSSAAAPGSTDDALSATVAPAVEAPGPNLHARPTGNGVSREEQRGRDDRALSISQSTMSENSSC